MLPKRTDKSFPEALKAAREAKELSFTELAELADLSPVMPSRYENREHSCFCAPSEKTWRKLNAILCGESAEPEGTLLEAATIEEIVTELKFRGAQSVKIDF
jgi:transcriptional regulator with XRE-family HTH domain